MNVICFNVVYCDSEMKHESLDSQFATFAKTSYTGSG